MLQEGDLEEEGDVITSRQPIPSYYWLGDKRCLAAADLLPYK